MSAPAECANATAQALTRACELGETGAHAEALRVLDQAVEADPDTAALHAARGWALENLEPAHMPQAHAAYRRAVALDPEDLWARLGLATVLEQLGHAADGAALYRTLVLEAPARVLREPELLELLGWCQYRLGLLDAATATFERALARDKTWVSVHFDLGLVALLRGDVTKALEHYRLGAQVLAARAPGRRAGPLKVALDDLDAALQPWPLSGGLAAAAMTIRTSLAEAAHEGEDARG